MRDKGEMGVTRLRWRLPRISFRTALYEYRTGHLLRTREIRKPDENYRKLRNSGIVLLKLV